MISDHVKKDNIEYYQMDRQGSDFRQALDAQNLFSCGLFQRFRKNNTLDKSTISAPVQPVHIIPLPYSRRQVSALPIPSTQESARSSTLSLSSNEASIGSILSYYLAEGGGYVPQNSSSSSLSSSAASFISSGSGSRSPDQGIHFSSTSSIDDNALDFLTPLIEEPLDTAPSLPSRMFLSIPDDVTSLYSRASKTFSDATEMTDLTKPSDDPATVEYTSVPVRNSYQESDSDYADQLNLEGQEMRHLFYQGNRARIIRRIGGNRHLGRNN